MNTLLEIACWIFLGAIALCFVGGVIIAFVIKHRAKRNAAKRQKVVEEYGENQDNRTNR